MGSAARRTVHSPQTAFRCPECGERVDTVMRRHKTLGAFVPVWGPGPCRNPDCSEYTGHPEHPDGDGDGDGATGPAVAGTA
ncbi:hypothetical protein [Streptomyces qinzhouensis]|uniref:Uncharacterized protein n=1 Tax=Streptomyces qinzhouensis TaxID=2599401 RepID=A0A5B8JMZ9_9ACTN|nr:hypothetical protein [Streptomyces qinzhouensis]QDY78963.1 hypothetical protein FQU76_23315 [Streptomyces qinzhouensis]